MFECASTSWRPNGAPLFTRRATVRLGVRWRGPAAGHGGRARKPLPPPPRSLLMLAKNSPRAQKTAKRANEASESPSCRSELLPLFQPHSVRQTGELRRCSALLSKGTAFADRGRVKRERVESIEGAHPTPEIRNMGIFTQKRKRVSSVPSAPG